MQRKILIVLIALVGIALLAYAFTHRDSATDATQTLNLSEFGVALEVPKSAGDVSYRATNENVSGPGTVLHMMTEDCEVGIIYKIDKNAIAKSGTPWTEKTLEEFQSPVGETPARVKEFTGFYLVFEPSQEPCTSDATQAQKDTTRRLALWQSLNSARYITY